MQSDLTPIIPVPPDAPEPPTKRARKRAGEWVHQPVRNLHEYYSLTLELLGYTAVLESGKVVPLTLWQDDHGKMVWKFWRFPGLSPLYNSHLLSRYRDAGIVVVDNEQQADVLCTKLDNEKVVTVTWTGDVDAVDWGHIYNRRVVLWCRDADKIAKHLMSGTKVVEPTDANLAILTKQEIATLLSKKNQRDPVAPPVDEPDPPPEPEPVDPAGIEWPFRILGHHEGYNYYLPPGTKQVVAIKRSMHGASTLIDLHSVSWWERTFWSKKSADWTAATDALLREAEKRGVWSGDRMRGRGAWVDNGRTVVHLGDRLLVDGQECAVDALGSRYIYPAGERLELDASAPLPKKEAAKFRDLCVSLRWERPLYGKLLAGWCVTAPICGGMMHRPSIWVTGPAGSGKTYVLDNIVHPVVSQYAIAASSDTTAPGLRQKLGCDALPVRIDEFEGESYHDQQRVADVLKLARQAFSDTESKIYKGSSGGQSLSYHIRSTFLFSSIAVNLAQTADLTRCVVLQLGKPRKDDAQKFPELVKAVGDTMTAKYCSGLRARSIMMLPVIKDNAKIFAAVLATRLGGQRYGDQLGTLLAGAYSLVSDCRISEDKAREIVDQETFESDGQTPEDTDECKCLASILTAIIRDESNHETTIAEQVHAAVQPADDFGHLPEAPGTVLSRHGCRVDGGYLYISDSHPVLRRILQSTPYAKGHGRLLRRIDGVVDKGRMRFTGTSTRASGVPVDMVLGG